MNKIYMIFIYPDYPWPRSIARFDRNIFNYRDQKWQCATSKVTPLAQTWFAPTTHLPGKSRQGRQGGSVDPVKKWKFLYYRVRWPFTGLQRLFYHNLL